MSDSSNIAAQDGQPLLRVLCASAMRATFLECAQDYHALSGAGFDIHWCTSGAVEQRIGGGEIFDLAGGARETLENLTWRALVQGPIADLGVSRLALGVRKGEVAPDISTPDKFEKAILAAKAISRGNPAGGGTAGKHLVKVFRQLFILEEASEKSILRAGGFNVMKEVAEGRADFGLTQSTEIPAVEGVEVGAYLPKELQMETLYALAVAHAGAHSMAGEFLKFMGSADARASFRKAGFAAP